LRDNSQLITLNILIDEFVLVSSSFCFKLNKVVNVFVHFLLKGNIPSNDLLRFVEFNA